MASGAGGLVVIGGDVAGTQGQLLLETLHQAQRLWMVRQRKTPLR